MKTKTKKGNVAMVAIIIVIVAVTTGIITWLVAIKSQTPVQQAVVNPIVPTTPVSQKQSAVQSTIPENQPSSAVPAGWKNFSSTTNNVSFNYPNTDVVSENKNVIKITGISGTAVANGTSDKVDLAITIYPNSGKYNLQVWFKSNFKSASDKNCVGNSVDNLRIGSYQAMLFDASTMQNACDDAGYYAISSGNSLVAKFSLGQDPLSDSDKILATFKFTN